MFLARRRTQRNGRTSVCVGIIARANTFGIYLASQVPEPWLHKSRSPRIGKWLHRSYGATSQNALQIRTSIRRAIRSSDLSGMSTPNEKSCRFTQTRRGSTLRLASGFPQSDGQVDRRSGALYPPGERDDHGQTFGGEIRSKRDNNIASTARGQRMEVA